MIDDFKRVGFEGFSPIAKAIGDVPSNLCDFTPYVMLTWRDFYKTEYAFSGEHLFLKYDTNGTQNYAPVSRDISEAVRELFKITEKERLVLSPLSEEQVRVIKENFNVTSEESMNDWSDYIYSHDDLSEFKGRKFSGQRNHINKFLSNFPDWSYEVINRDNVSEVGEFYREISKDETSLNETALFEKKRLLEYFENGFSNFDMSGGLIRADGRVVSFAFGETLNDMLFVHVEKANRDIQGAYQMIVREFARHNPALYINREEDMGLEGLRRSKESYHPIRLEKKYCLTIKI